MPLSKLKVYAMNTACSSSFSSSSSSPALSKPISVSTSSRTSRFPVGQRQHSAWKMPRFAIQSTLALAWAALAWLGIGVGVGVGVGLVTANAAGSEAKAAVAVPAPAPAAVPVAAVPRFSVDYMDTSVDPGADFFRYAAGRWLTNSPVPGDKSRWSGFDELQQRNWTLIRALLEESTTDAHIKSGPKRQVADFYLSAMDTNRIEKLGATPVADDLNQLAKVRSIEGLFKYIGKAHINGVGAAFGWGAAADAKDSEHYVLYLGQGGLGMPNRDYYLQTNFAKVRLAYEAHIVRMLQLLGDSPSAARLQAGLILDLETDLAKVSKTQVELRDQLANYHKMTRGELQDLASAVPWDTYFKALGAPSFHQVVVRQPAFFQELTRLLRERPLSVWKTYLRWHVLRDAAPVLSSDFETESFAFNDTTIRGTPRMEPRWQRAARAIDANIGEALGQMFVEKHFPPAAKARMLELVTNVKAVVHDRLGKLDWMSEATRQKALAKFERFTQKIGYPDKFRDYSTLTIDAKDYYGNAKRASAFESRRRLARLGQKVDRTEWGMTPQTVNAYFSPTMNEIVFPAGILQPPFFDMDLDDAVNYGAIGVVIGHEITHGYDDQGRRFDADGNLNDWWTAKDAEEFQARAKKVIDQFNAYEALPGVHVNGELSQGENIADLGGCSIALEAYHKSLQGRPEPEKRDNLTADQRFFLSLAQLWRTNWRKEALQRQITVGPHAPGQFRAIGPHVNMEEFYRAFDIKPGAPLYRPPEQRAKIW